MKNPGILFLILLAVLLSLYGSMAKAQLIDYSYLGNPFNHGQRQLQIHFLVDDGLISEDGHFEAKVNFSVEDSPFNAFIISDGVNAISDLGLNPKYDYRHQKYLDVAFNTDINGDIKNWKITADAIYMSPFRGSFYTIESVYNFENLTNQDSVLAIDIDEWGEIGSNEKYTLDTNHAAGYWTRTLLPEIPVSSVPLPGGLLFFVTGLCGLFWRRLVIRFRSITVQ
jgi:hypothetical protein